MKRSASRVLKWIIAFVVLFACSFPAIWWHLNVLELQCFVTECVPERSFSTYDLNVPEQFFPSDVAYGAIGPSRYGPKGSLDYGFNAHYWSGSKGAFVYKVVRFSSLRNAQQWYESRAMHYEATYSVDVVQHTQDYRTHCEGTEVCEAVLLYEEYGYYFNAQIDELFTVLDFEKVVQYIDEDMAQRLDLVSNLEQ